MSHLSQPPAEGNAAALRQTTVWFMAASTGLIVANIYYIQPLLGVVSRQFGLTSSGAGAIAMITQIGTCLGMLVFVPLGDSHERRGLITWMLVGTVISLVLTAAARNTLWLAAACFGVGVSASTVHLFVPFAAHLAPPAKRGHVVGTVFSGVLLGILLARTFSGFVGSHLGWRMVYVIAAALILLACILVQFLLPRSEPTVRLSYFSLLKSTLQLVREHAELREAALLGGAALACFSAFWTTLVFLLARPPYHYGAQAAGLFGLVGAAGAVGAPIVGRITDKRGARFTISFALVLLFVSYAILVLGGTSLIGLIVGVLAMDFSTQSCHVANQTRIYGLTSDARSRVNTFYMVCYFAGGALGSLFGAYAWKLYGWNGVCGFCLLVIGAALVKFRFWGVGSSPAVAKALVTREGGIAGEDSLEPTDVI